MCENAPDHLMFAQTKKRHETYPHIGTYNNTYVYTNEKKRPKEEKKK